MRELKRSIARANMRALGMEKIHKKRGGGKKAPAQSFFARCWRDYVYNDVLYRERRRKAHAKRRARAALGGGKAGAMQ